MVYKTLVFSGGGTRCLVLAELLVLLEHGGHLHSVEKLYGTSAGALLAALYTLSRSASHAKKILWDLDFSSFRNVEVSNLLNFMNTWAMDDGTALQTSINKLLDYAVTDGSVLLLRDVPSLHICVADLTVRQTIVLSAANYPLMRVGEAIRVSMTLPIFIKPFVSPEGHIWVDGGVRANFPWFVVPETERDSALGLCFMKTEFESPRNLSEYILSMIHFDESKKTKVPYGSKQIICASTPPFPAWFLRLRPTDYELVITLARAAYDDWIARLTGGTGLTNVTPVCLMHPPGNCGTPLPSAPPHTPLPVSPVHHTVEPLDIPRVSQEPSRDSSPHSPPRKLQIVRRWSF
jgi:predicted patatin/cPLA2 family phospholipase